MLSQRVHYHIQVNASQISPRSTPSELLKESSTSSTLPENHPSVAELHPGHQRCQGFIRICRRTSSRTSTLPEIHPHRSVAELHPGHQRCQRIIRIRRRTSSRTLTLPQSRRTSSRTSTLPEIHPHPSPNFIRTSTLPENHPSVAELHPGH